jgi:hypothetical protein
VIPDSFPSRLMLATKKERLGENQFLRMTAWGVGEGLGVTSGRPGVSRCWLVERQGGRERVRLPPVHCCPAHATTHGRWAAGDVQGAWCSAWIRLARRAEDTEEEQYPHDRTQHGPRLTLRETYGDRPRVSAVLVGQGSAARQAPHGWMCSHGPACPSARVTAAQSGVPGAMVG